MGDGRVGQQALHVRLPVGGQIAECARHGRQDRDHKSDVLSRWRQVLEQDGIGQEGKGRSQAD